MIVRATALIGTAVRPRLRNTGIAVVRATNGQMGGTAQRHASDCILAFREVEIAAGCGRVRWAADIEVVRAALLHRTGLTADGLPLGTAAASTSPLWTAVGQVTPAAGPLITGRTTIGKLRRAALRGRPRRAAVGKVGRATSPRRIRRAAVRQVSAAATRVAQGRVTAMGMR